MENLTNEYLSNNNTEEGSCRDGKNVSTAPKIQFRGSLVVQKMLRTRKPQCLVYPVALGQNKGVCKWQMAIIDYVQKIRTASTGR